MLYGLVTDFLSGSYWVSEFWQISTGGWVKNMPTGSEFPKIQTFESVPSSADFESGVELTNFPAVILHLNYLSFVLQLNLIVVWFVICFLLLKGFSWMR